MQRNREIDGRRDKRDGDRDPGRTTTKMTRALRLFAATHQTKQRHSEQAKSKIRFRDGSADVMAVPALQDLELSIVVSSFNVHDMLYQGEDTHV